MKNAALLMKRMKGGDFLVARENVGSLRLLESPHRSLLALGNVITALSEGRQGHIPYRDSTLTRLLQVCSAELCWHTIPHRRNVGLLKLTLVVRTKGID